ncbi:hypothetical protein LMANV2_170015 [Leptospira interrogans serovar Manilae]|uniref:Uncharacterized protein n=1 Tax=Leptospira interrogans serovar Manilae TaxID=214675 RepID=A0AAQ1SMI6_LEPIR|nr:hypothetical protein LMANV2_170015 [Leptospira interrogans serovar Manilae]
MRTTTDLCLRTNSENVETLITKNKCLKIRNVTKFVGTLTFIRNLHLKRIHTTQIKKNFLK